MPATRLSLAFTLAVAAAPEKGKANKAIIALLAKMLNISRRHIAVVGGHASPLKTIRIEQVDADILRDALNSPNPDGNDS